MKRLMVIVTILFISFISSTIYASPYLICNPQSGVDYYTVIDNGNSILMESQSDGSIKWDLANISIGTHNLTVSACDILWGCSDTVPFGFTRNGKGNPSNIRLIK